MHGIYRCTAKLTAIKPDQKVASLRPGCLPTVYFGRYAQYLADVDQRATPETILHAQALKARGEPLLSGFETTPEGINARFAPLHWQLTELLSPK